MSVVDPREGEGDGGGVAFMALRNSPKRDAMSWGAPGCGCGVCGLQGMLRFPRK